MNDIFDPKSVLPEIGGEEELLREMAEIFLSVYNDDMEMIEKAIESGDGENIRVSAHRLKGSVANFGKKRPFSAAKALEDAARSNDLEGMDRLFSELKKDISDLDAALRDYCRGVN